MKKILLVMLAIMIIASGCTTNESKQEETIKITNKEKPVEAQEEEIKPKLDGLKQAFKDAGFEIGENELVAFELLNANNGMKFKLDGELLEIYEYDMNNLSDEAKITVDQAKEGSVDMSGFKIDVIFKDGLMLVRHNSHSQGEKIIEVFNSYKE